MGEGLIKIFKKRIALFILFLPVTERFTLIQTVEGKKLWELKAESARKEEEKTFFSNIELNLFSHPVKKITAKTAEYKKGEGRMHNDVMLFLKDGTKILTQSLIWNEKEKLFFTNEDAIIKKGNFSLSVKAFEVREDGTLSVSSPSGEGTNTVYAKKAKISTAKEMMELEGNVLLRLKDLEFQAERMTILGSLSSPEQIKCEGNAKLLKKEFSAEAKRLFYKMKDEIGVMEEEVKIKKGDIIGECAKLRIEKGTLILEQSPRITKIDLEIKGSIIKIAEEEIVIEGDVWAKVKME